MRPVATVIVAFLLLLVQSTWLELMPVHLPTPALGLLAVLHVGLSGRWSLSTAALMAFAIGYLFDLVAGTPRGLHPFAFVVLVLLARLLAARVAVRGAVMRAATGFVASLFTSLLVIIVRAQVAPDGGYAGLRQVPLEALLTAACAPVVLFLLERLDGRLDPARLRVGLARRRARRLAGASGSR